MSNRRYTLIATVRNEAVGIRDFVDSLLAQRRAPDEIVIVDGASTDGTREILEEYAARGALRVISKPCNIAEGRNLGISAATGTHLAVTDAGCKVDADWLREIDSAFDHPSMPDVVAGNFRYECHNDFEEAVVRATFQPHRDGTENARFYPSSRSIAFSKAAWQQAGGYPEWLYAAEDTLFNIRLRQLGHHFVFAREAIVRWRPRETWRALARQRVNFARGNARVGIGESGYLLNLRVHVSLLLSVLAGGIHPVFLFVALLLAAQHAQRRLWPQAKATTGPGEWGMRIRVMTVMEYVRLVSLYGFMLGKLDRWRDPRFTSEQIRYMGVPSVAALNLDGRTPRSAGALHPGQIAALGLALLGGSVALSAQGLVASLHAAIPALALGLLFTISLLLKSLRDFSHTGPRIRDEIRQHYRRDTWIALVRLCLAAWFIFALLAGTGLLLIHGLYAVLGEPPPLALCFLGGLAGIAVGLALQFVQVLRFNPGLLVASMHYRMSHLHAIWRWLTPGRLRALTWLSGALVLVLILFASRALMANSAWRDLSSLWGLVVAYGGLLVLLRWEPEARPRQAPLRPEGAPPHILMIGSDTLRADRLGVLGYRRSLTPNLDRLAGTGTLFGNCYVPCARTAPSLASLFTGGWPQRHGIRDNFVADTETRLPLRGLPAHLRPAGYRSVVLSDWCGADFGKLDLGFDQAEVAPDQWNLRYLIRQGPKDLRLLVSLFSQHALGRRLLPEIHYLGGVPMTTAIGRRARRLMSELATRTEPFLLNVFFSTTHPPFASEWPWYTHMAQPAYAGESKFAMAKLTDPFEIIRRQGAPREEFDLEQIEDLYDGCVAHFDHEVGLILAHLKACGLHRDTLVVVYSDHGMEFFEHDTWGQGNSAVGEASPRIPLLLAGPGIAPQGVNEQVVRSVDVVPTLLDLLGLSSREPLDGVSLAPFLRQEVAAPPALDAFNETGLWLTRLPGQAEDHLHYPELFELLEVPDRASGTLAIKPEFQQQIIAAKDRMVRRGRWKLVLQPLVSGLRPLLYDLGQDPGCLTDVSALNPAVVAELTRALDEWWTQGL